MSKKFLIVCILMSGWFCSVTAQDNCVYYDERYTPPDRIYNGQTWDPLWNFENMKQKRLTLPSVSQGRFKGMLEFTPPGYNFADKTKKYAIIIFFHGNGGKGNATVSLNQLCRLFKDRGSDRDGHKALPGRVERETSILTQTDQVGNTVEFIVASPQYVSYDRLYNPDGSPKGLVSYPSAAAVDSVIDYMVDVKYKDKIDESRIYLTGFSNGANMVLEYAGSSVARAKRVAAIMPIALCSQLGHPSNTGITAANIANAKLKTWFVYCTDDNCGDDVSRDWVNAIRLVSGNVSPRLTVLNNSQAQDLYKCSSVLPHDAWSRAYDPLFKTSFTGDGTGMGSSTNDGVNQNMYQWFANQQNATLPVLLKSFDARLIDKKVEVRWVTTAEINNSSFDIERAGPDQVFSSIGTVPGSGDYRGEKEYQFTDASPLAGLSFYRLAQTDIDGKKQYFEIKKIMNNENKASSVIVSPNPFAGDMTAFVSLDKSQRVVITVADMNGKILKNSTGVYAQGNSELKIKTSDFPRGVYLLKVSGENFNSIQKIIKK